MMVRKRRAPTERGEEQDHIHRVGTQGSPSGNNGTMMPLMVMMSVSTLVRRA